MNKKLVLLMILSILLVFSSCGQSAPLEKEIEASEPSLVKVGVLPDIIDNETANNVYAHITEEHGVINADANKQIVKYEDLSSALSDLRAESIGFFGVNSATASYIIENNEDLAIVEVPFQEAVYSMATLEDNTELYDILNSAINEMKADGTMDFLADVYLTMQPSVETEPVEMPVIEGAKTYKVAVTGELPPLDHLSADGVPTGFNVAVLSEISKRANINIELEVMGPDARFSALNSGRIDAFFWTTAIRCEEHPEIGAIEFYGGIKFTEEYVSLNISAVKKK